MLLLVFENDEDKNHYFSIVYKNGWHKEKRNAVRHGSSDDEWSLSKSLNVYWDTPIKTYPSTHPSHLEDG